MSVYWDVLEACRDALEAMPAFRDADSGGPGRRYRVHLHREPAWSEALHAWPAVVVAPRADLCERAEDEHMDGKLVLGLEVYVGVALQRDNTAASLRERLARREEVRLRLRDSTPLHGSVAGLYSVRYDPSPPVPQSWPDTLDVSWQLFTYLVETRQSDAG